MSTLGLDHLVIHVPNLKRAIAQFEALGFAVTPGGEHQFTHNALIFFDDTIYLELFAVKPGLTGRLLKLAASIGWIGYHARGRDDMGWRLYQWITGPYGSIDWCLRTDDVEAVLQDWQALGVPSLGSESYSRTRPDGQIVEWILGSPKDYDLPFLVSDLTDFELRVQPGNADHPNGVKGVVTLMIASDQLTRSANRFDQIFDRQDSNGAFQVGAVGLQLANQSDFAGKWALRLKADISEPVILDPQLSYGTQIELVPA